MGTFQLDDDDDAFWGDDATFGQIDTLCRQAEARQAASQHASGSGATPLPVRRPDTGGATTSPSPLRAPLRLEPGLGDPSQMQPHTKPHEHAKRNVAVPSGPDSSGGGTGSAPLTAAAAPRYMGAPTALGGDSGSDPASLAALLRDKERQLNEKEAHLKMLRSRLEMAERDGETARRRLEASQIEREREKERERNRDAGAGGGGYANYNLNTNVSGGDKAFGRHDDGPARNNGPKPMDVSNAAALQEARAELARLKARVAFKDEEAEEARRREDEHRASLQRAEAEAMRLAAEVRRERRRAAAAEAESDAASFGGKRRRDDGHRRGLGDPGGDPRGVSGAAALPDVGTNIAAGVLSLDGADGQHNALPAPPPAPPVSLVLPPPPPAASAFPPERSLGVASSAAAAFAATVASAPAAARAILGFAARPNSATMHWSSYTSARSITTAVSSGTNDRVEIAALKLRDTLSDLAADAATAACFATAAAELVVTTAAELENLESFESDEQKPSVKERASFLLTAARDAMFVLTAISRADVNAAEQIQMLFGCGTSTGASNGAVNSTANRSAPRPPPEPLAGVPAAGTDSVGFLVPHPGIVGSQHTFTRVFALSSPPETVSVSVVNDIGVVNDGGDDKNVEGAPGKKTNSGAKNVRSPFLDAALVILASSLSSGDWYAARSALRLLSRAAAEADPLRGRGVFAAALDAGHLARALGGDGEKLRLNARGGSGTEGASADLLTGGRDDADAAGDRRKNASVPTAVRIQPATATHSHRRRPPARVRRDVLALARLLAGTPEFAASLSRGGGENVSVRVETTKRMTNDKTKNAALNDDDDRETLKNARGSTSDGEDEDAPDCPLLRAVVACVEEFAEEALEASLAASSSYGRRVSKARGVQTLAFTASDDAFAVEDELETVCAYHRVGSATENLNAALLTLAAISHAGWPGWGDAVRRHGVLAAAVAAAEAAFAAAATSAAASAADQRRVRHALMFVARLLAEPASARAASSALRRDGETCRRLARVARAANAHAEQMPRRVGKYLDSVLAAWS